ncbi:MAG: hypothetical protein E7328_02600 [Clostridiales bacterium]|nr:hypothetical protein [Clostridiales bacterium]
MDPELENMLKKQMYFRLALMCVMAVLAVWLVSYFQHWQGTALRNGILKDAATEEEMALYAQDLEFTPILDGTFVSGELKGSLADGDYRFILTLSYTAEQLVDARLQMGLFTKGDPAESSLTPPPDLYYTRTEPAEEEKAEDRTLCMSIYLEEEGARCIFQWSTPGQKLCKLYTEE